MYLWIRNHLTLPYTREHADFDQSLYTVHELISCLTQLVLLLLVLTMVILNPTYAPSNHKYVRVYDETGASVAVILAAQSDPRMVWVHVI